MKPPKPRNPIARVVKKIRPKVVPDKKKLAARKRKKVVLKLVETLHETD